MKSIDLELGSRFADVRFTSVCNISLIRAHIQMIEHKQKDHHIKEQNRKKVQAPEERNPSHESHQKWRITDRCQAATHVGHHKDEKDHNVAFSLSPGIHFDHRTHHQHTGSGGSNTAGKQSSQCKKSYIYSWRTRKIALNCNVTGYTEQSE